MGEKTEITTNTKVFLPKKRATWTEVQEQRMKRQEKERQRLKEIQKTILNQH